MGAPAEQKFNWMSIFFSNISLKKVVWSSKNKVLISIFFSFSRINGIQLKFNKATNDNFRSTGDFQSRFYEKLFRSKFFLRHVMCLWGLPHIQSTRPIASMGAVSAIYFFTKPFEKNINRERISSALSPTHTLKDAL